MAPSSSIAGDSRRPTWTGSGVTSSRGAASGSIRSVSRTPITMAGGASTSNCGVRLTPVATAPAPMPAPRKAPTLHQAWNPFISGRFWWCSTAIACVFIATSSVPWKAPHNMRAANSEATDPAMPMSGPHSA